MSYCNDIYVNGVGIYTPLDSGYLAFCERLLNKKFQIKQCLDTYTMLENEFGGAKEKDSLIRRFDAILLSTLKDTLTRCDRSMYQNGNCTLILGTGLGLYNYTQVMEKANLAKHIEIVVKSEYTFIDNVIIMSNACAASSDAICYGMELVGNGICEKVIVGGIDVYTPIAYAGFQRLRAIDDTGCHPFGRDRKGIMVGEGAGFLLLESVKRNNTYVKLLSFYSTNDAYDVVGIEQTGTNIKRAMKNALVKAKMNAKDIDLILAHGTGTILNDRIEGECIETLFSTYDTPIVATKSYTGHTGGASGVINMIYGIFMMTHSLIISNVNVGCIDGIFNRLNICIKDKKRKIENVMVNCFAFGGSNVIITMTQDYKEVKDG